MYKFKIYFAAAAALLLAACSDESSNEVVPATGTDVTFSTSLGVNSRTYYGEREGDAFPIYWNTEKKGFDRIMIFSGECTPKVAEYEVQIEGTDETNYSANVVKTGEVGLRWGEASTATFYAIYPSSAVVDETTFNGNSVKAEIPAAQYAQAITQNGTSFVCEPNMDYALMYAVAPNVPNDGKNGVALNFTPLPTVLDITVNGPTGNLANNSIRVTSVQVRSTDPDTPIAGDFQVNLADGTCTSVGNDFTNITAFFNNDGGAITLTEGQSINLKVFLRPGITNANNLEVQVNTASGGYLKKLTNAGTLVKGQIHPLSMPKFETIGEVLNPANWMAMLDPNIYITELSIPGAWSANMVGSGTENNQAVDYTEQYNSGIRAFLFETQYRSTNNSIVLRGTRTEQLSTVLTTLSSMMEDHPEEFVVVMLTDWTEDDHNPNWISAIKTLIKGNPAVYQDEITPETTIADVKGKIIIKINDNPGSNDYTSEYTYTDEIPAILSMYNSKEGATSDTSTPLIWGENRGYNNANPSMWWYYTEAGEMERAGLPTITERENAITSLLRKAAAHERNQWFMFGLGGKRPGVFLISSDNAQYIAEELNPYMLEQIGDNAAVPLGLVMMNSADRTSTKAIGASSNLLIDAIINNNNAFDLEKRPSTNNN